jgi:integrase
MPRITFNIELSSKADRTGRWSVMIRLHMKGQKPARVLTSVKIVGADKCWNPKKTWEKWVIKHPNKAALNIEIEREYQRVKTQVQKWQEAGGPNDLLTPALLAERFRAGVSDRYFDWVDKVLEDNKDQAYSTYIGKRSAATMFKKWVGAAVNLQSISPLLVRQFQHYLVKSPIKEGRYRKATTVNEILAKLHIIHKHVLIKMGIPLNQVAIQSPWTEIIPLKEVKSRKGKLSEATINWLAQLPVKSKRRKLTPEIAFRIWRLTHLLAGARFADIMLLRYNNFTLDTEGRPIQLQYEMQKTGNFVRIPIFEESRNLLNFFWKSNRKPTDYLLPYLNNKAAYAKLLTHEQYRTAPFAVRKKLHNTLRHWNQQVNLSLKELQEMADLPDKLRTHNARYSFADLARRIMVEDKSITVYDIQLMLGHRDFKTTEGYYRDEENQDVTEAMRAIFDRKK